jgi:hypothetical protein
MQQRTDPGCIPRQVFSQAQKSEVAGLGFEQYVEIA